MELVCPQCSKQLLVSAEEVALHGGAVVCPQCLSVFDASSHVPEGTVAERPVRVIEEHLTYGYCPHCGRKIPKGVNYCPYCGQELALAGGFAEAEPAPPAPQPEAKPASGSAEPQAAGTTAQADGERVKHHSSSHRSSSHRSSSHRSSSRAWQPVMPTYRYSKLRGGLRSDKQKAGPLFTMMAWMAIVALLALLAFIIHKVNLLP